MFKMKYAVLYYSVLSSFIVTSLTCIQYVFLAVTATTPLFIDIHICADTVHLCVGCKLGGLHL